ncbi:D-aspartate oxidase [Hypsibius exemplaris]|uniref:D-aspartate oxidase n=1 Tax=Hypsibius exemplaris TaxID=2072580 RepID=A0A9X6RMY6_HYPEX|nr:D-aspartate oxidase [Hypsibius exemplaris]
MDVVANTVVVIRTISFSQSVDSFTLSYVGSTMRVAIVGAGVIGLSSAVCIQSEVPGAEVTIIAELTDVHTTSDGAAGFFHPGHISADNAADARQWLKDSAEHFWKLCYTEDAVDYGIFEMSGYAFSNTNWDVVEKMGHETVPDGELGVKNYRRLTDSELSKFSGGPWRCGAFKTTLITEPRIMMVQLNKQFLANNGSFLRQKLDSLADLVGQFDVVVNCSGLGARTLVGDKSVYPIRGQVARLNAPWLKHFYHVEHDIYMLPNRDAVVVGGCRQENNWSTELCDADREHFLKKNAELFPSIKRAPIVREWVGLRPGRPTVRLELEEMQFPGDKVLPVIHNYGHGGNGITLSWGCGRHVARIVQQLEQNK